MKDLITNDISRCNNYKCPTGAFCARFKQLQIDRQSPELKPVSVTHFNGNEKENLCEYFINADAVE